MTTKQISAVIFDLDGTLADTLADIAASGNYVLRNMGLSEEPVDAYRMHVGDGLRVMGERALTAAQGSASTAEIDTFERRFREHYDGHHLDTTRPYDGIVSTLSRLSDAGLALAVLSNKPHDYTREMVADLFPTLLFAEVWGHREEYPRKPDPTSACALAQELGLRPERCAFVGDTKVDMLTATRAGMRAIGVLWGFRARAELEEHGADSLCERPEDLIRLLSKQRV